jgi:hypothetical protein
MFLTQTLLIFYLFLAIVNARYEEHHQDSCSQNCLLDCDVRELKAKIELNTYENFKPWSGRGLSKCNPGALFELDCQLQYRRASTEQNGNLSPDFHYVVEHLR